MLAGANLLDLDHVLATTGGDAHDLIVAVAVFELGTEILRLEAVLAAIEFEFLLRLFPSGGDRVHAILGDRNEFHLGGKLDITNGDARVHDHSHAMFGQNLVQGRDQSAKLLGGFTIEQRKISLRRLRQGRIYGDHPVGSRIIFWPNVHPNGQLHHPPWIQ